MKGDLTDNFSRHEFACKGGDNCCGGSAPISERLVEALQKLSDMVHNIPLHINSGFRCVKYNGSEKVTDGASFSAHCLGLATDVDTPDGMTEDQIVALAEQIPDFYYGGIGKYPGRVHLDVRKGGPYRWEVL